MARKNAPPQLAGSENKTARLTAPHLGPDEKYAVGLICPQIAFAVHRHISDSAGKGAAKVLVPTESVEADYENRNIGRRLGLDTGLDHHFAEAPIAPRINVVYCAHEPDLLLFQVDRGALIP